MLTAKVLEAEVDDRLTAEQILGPVDTLLQLLHLGIQRSDPLAELLDLIGGSDGDIDLKGKRPPPGEESRRMGAKGERIVK